MYLYLRYIGKVSYPALLSRMRKFLCTVIATSYLCYKRVLCWFICSYMYMQVILTVTAMNRILLLTVFIALFCTVAVLSQGWVSYIVCWQVCNLSLICHVVSMSVVEWRCRFAGFLYEPLFTKYMVTEKEKNAEEKTHKNTQSKDRKA